MSELTSVKFLKRTVSALILFALLLTASCGSSGDDLTVDDMTDVDHTDMTEMTELTEATEATDMTDEMTEETTEATVEVTTTKPSIAPGAPVTDKPAETTTAKTTAKTTAVTTKRTASSAPNKANPTGGYGVVIPPYDVSPKITTTAKGEPPKAINQGGFAGVGETITIEGFISPDETTATTEQQTVEPNGGGTMNVEIDTSVPLLDGVECVVNQAVLDSIAAEDCAVFASPVGLERFGLDASIYDESFFASSCLVIFDTAMTGTVSATRVLSVKETAEGELTLTVRCERTAQNGVSYRRYILELPSAYAAHKPIIKKQFADVNTKFASSGGVATRISFSYKLNYPTIGTTLTNTYAIPALTFDTVGARSVNEAIERTVYTVCGELISGYADGIPGVASNVTYKWGQQSDNGIIWIMLYINDTGTTSINAARAYGFYYDVFGGKRLSITEYLAANGMTASKVVSDLASGYSVTITAAQVENVCVFGKNSYKYIYHDGSATYEFLLPIRVLGNGVRYLCGVDGEGMFNALTVVLPNGKQYSVGGFTSVTEPTLTFDASNLLMSVYYTTASGGSFMVISLENGSVLYICTPDNADVAEHYGMPTDSVMLFEPKIIEGTSSNFRITMNVTLMHGSNKQSGMMLYDSLSGKLSYLTADGLSVDGPWMHTPTGGGLEFTNGTIKRTVTGNFGASYAVEYTSDWHYAAIAAETSSFSIDFVRAGQPTLTTRYGIQTITVADLSTGKVHTLAPLTAADVITACGLTDIGYTHLAITYGTWVTNSTFTLTMTLIAADSAQSVPLLATCEVTSNGIAVVSIES